MALMRSSPYPWMQIRASRPADFDAILAIVNDAAQAYKGVIPADRWHDPYMPRPELEREIGDGIRFWIAEDGDRPLGVMGIQDKGDVTLVRHAYVSTALQRKGIGSKLLRHLEGLTAKPILIGTWKDATWAISFYQRHGYTLVSEPEKDALLGEYWSIPARQVETSVVLADRRYVSRA